MGIRGRRQNGQQYHLRRGLICSNEFMHCSLPAFSAQSTQIAKSISKSDRSSIASINVSSMISMPSFAPSASKPHDKGAKREQNPPYSHYKRSNPAHRAIGAIARTLSAG